MVSTSTPLGQNFAKEMVDILINGLSEGMKRGAHMAWDVLMVFLKDHWLSVMVLFFALFFVVTLKAMMGRWGALGSFLYNSLYFGTLFIVGLIWGPEVFVNDFFNTACAVILYPVCYFVVGLILKKTGARNLGNRTVK